MKYFNDKFWDYSKNIWLQQADESGDAPKKSPRKTEGGDLYQTDLVKKRMGKRVDRTLKGDKPVAPESSELETRMTALEALVVEQAETIKGLEERVAELEGRETPEATPGKKPVKKKTPLKGPEIPVRREKNPVRGEKTEHEKDEERRLAKEASTKAEVYAETAKQLAEQHPTSEAKKLRDEVIEVAKISAEIAEDAQNTDGQMLIALRKSAEQHKQTAKRKSEEIQKLINTASTKTSEDEATQTGKIEVDSSAVKKGPKESKETVIIEEETPLGNEQRLAHEAAVNAKRSIDEASELMKTGSRPVARLVLKARMALKKANFASDEAKKVDTEERAKFFRQHAEFETQNAIENVEQAKELHTADTVDQADTVKERTKKYEVARGKEEQARKVRKVLRIKILGKEELTKEQQQLLDELDPSKLAMVEESIQRELNPKPIDKREEIPDEREPIVEEIQSREDADRKLAEIQGIEYTQPDPYLPPVVKSPTSRNVPLQTNIERGPASSSPETKEEKLEQAKNTMEGALKDAHRIAMRADMLNTASSIRTANETRKNAKEIYMLYKEVERVKNVKGLNKLISKIETLSQKIYHLSLPKTARAKSADKDVLIQIEESYKDKDSLNHMLYEWIKNTTEDERYVASEREKSKEWIETLDAWEKAHPEYAEVKYKGKKSPEVDKPQEISAEVEEDSEPQKQEVAVEKNTALLAKKAEVEEAKRLATEKRAEADAAEGFVIHARAQLKKKDTAQRRNKLERRETKFTRLDGEARQLEEIAVLHQKELNELEQGTETPEE